MRWYQIKLKGGKVIEDTIKSKEEAIYFLNRYFFSTTEAIEFLGISKANFYSLIARGKSEKSRKEPLDYTIEKKLSKEKSAYCLRIKYRPFDYEQL